MKIAWRHRWDVTPAMARQIQVQARRRLVLADETASFLMPEWLAAVDVSYDRATGLAAASLVAWDCRRGEAAGRWSNVEPTRFPYVPGLLSFREIPPLIPLLRKLRVRPPLLLCDAHGYAHPRRLGMASHLGIIYDCPSLGWAKSLLVGEHALVPPVPGAAVPLMHRGEQVGWAMCAGRSRRPTYISPGHRVSMARALEMARALAGPHRLPAPAREAHSLTRLAMRLALNHRCS